MRKFLLPFLVLLVFAGCSNNIVNNPPVNSDQEQKITVRFFDSQRQSYFAEYEGLRYLVDIYDENGDYLNTVDKPEIIDPETFDKLKEVYFSVCDEYIKQFEGVDESKIPQDALLFLMTLEGTKEAYESYEDYCKYNLEVEHPYYFTNLNEIQFSIAPGVYTFDIYAYEENAYDSQAIDLKPVLYGSVTKKLEALTRTAKASYRAGDDEGISTGGTIGTIGTGDTGNTGGTGNTGNTGTVELNPDNPQGTEEQIKFKDFYTILEEALKAAGLGDFEREEKEYEIEPIYVLLTPQPNDYTGTAVYEVTYDLNAVMGINYKYTIQYVPLSEYVEKGNAAPWKTVASINNDKEVGKITGTEKNLKEGFYYFQCVFFIPSESTENPWIKTYASDVFEIKNGLVSYGDNYFQQINGVNN